MSHRTEIAGSGGPLKVSQERAPRLAENPGFLAQDRPASYAATQEIILPKGAVYEQIISRVPWQPGREITLAEFGFGTGAFLKRLIGALAARGQAARIVAFDLAPAMGDFARSELGAELERLAPNGGGISLELVTGVNCLDPDFGPAEFSRGSALDAVFQIQFSHYAPNGPETALAVKTQKDGVRKVTKLEWIAKVHGWMKPGGVLFDFDDFDSNCPLLNEISFKAWDLWVLRSLTNPEVQRQIAQAHPNLGRSIAKAYPPTATVAQLLESVERRRRKRRSFCREETAPLRACVGWLEGVFGEGQVQALENPIGFSHHRFHLLVSTKR